MSKQPSKKIVDYVVGLMFSPTQDLPAAVCLIRKKRPGWQEGKLNGPGGHVEEKDPDMYHAMAREFEEETGAKIVPSEWEHIATLIFDNVTSFARVHYLRTFSQVQVRTITDEKVEWHEVKALIQSDFANCVGHLYYTIPLAVRLDRSHQQIFAAGTEGAPRTQGEEDDE
jgi:8-oxo-dGTP pyrophosphatase MutT (NUDIX family)